MKLLLTLFLLGISLSFINCFKLNKKINLDSTILREGNGDSKYIVSKEYSFLDKQCSEQIVGNNIYLNNYCSDSMSMECNKVENTLTMKMWSELNCTGSIAAHVSIPTNECNSEHGVPTSVSCEDELDLPTENSIISFVAPKCNEFKTSFTQVVTQTTNLCFNNGEQAMIYSCDKTDITYNLYRQQATCSGSPTQSTTELIQKCRNEDNSTTTVICV